MKGADLLQVLAAMRLKFASWRPYLVRMSGYAARGHCSVGAVAGAYMLATTTAPLADALLPFWCLWLAYFLLCCGLYAFETRAHNEPDDALAEMCLAHWHGGMRWLAYAVFWGGIAWVSIITAMPHMSGGTLVLILALFISAMGTLKDALVVAPWDEYQKARQAGQAA